MRRRLYKWSGKGEEKTIPFGLAKMTELSMDQMDTKDIIS